MTFFDDDDEDTKHCDVLPLVTFADGKYVVNEEALQLLEEIKEPIAAVAVAGKTRTGKSFLLNRLTKSNGLRGFPVGSSVQACTKGIYCYRVLPSSADGKSKVLFMDTEGIDALDADDTHDVRIFTLALLLSNTFLYNSVGVIDEAALQILNLMTRVVNNIRVTQGPEGASDENLASHMPRFFWVLRDFALRLVNRNGLPISERAYLEEALTTEDEAKAHVRQTISGAFPVRELVTLPRPVNDDSNISFMQERPSSITSKFSNAVERLSKMIVDTAPLQAHGRPITGSMFVQMVRHYVKIVNSDAVPVIHDSYTLMAKVQARDLRDSLLAATKIQVDALSPLPEAQMRDTLKTIVEDVLRHFDDTIMIADPPTRTDLKERLDAMSRDAMYNLSERILKCINESLAAADAAICAAPENLHSILVLCSEEFSEKILHDSAAIAMWNAHSYEQLMGHWLTIGLGRLKHERDEAVRQKTEAEDSVSRTALQADDSRALQAQTHVLEIDKLRLENESLLAQIQNLKETIEELRDELSQPRQPGEMTVFVDKECDGEEGAKSPVGEQVLSEIQHAMDDWSQRRIALEGEVDSLKQRVQQLTEELQETGTALDAEKNTRQQLDERWQKGMRTLEQDTKRAVAMAKQDAKLQAVELQENMQKMKKENMEQSEKIARLLEEKKLCEGKIATLLETFERERKQMRELANTTRIQTDATQQKLTDMHRQMLEEMRLKEDKYSESVRDSERAHSQCRELKRRISDVEPSLRELRDVKQTLMEKNIATARSETELAHTKAALSDTNAERERLRQQNLQLENTVAVVKTEKRIAESKRVMEE